MQLLRKNMFDSFFDCETLKDNHITDSELWFVCCCLLGKFKYLECFAQNERRLSLVWMFRPRPSKAKHNLFGS